MKNLKTATLVLVFMLGFSSLFAQEKESTRLYAVMFHADYCGACKSISPKIMDLESQVKDQGVEFVKFDFTSAESKKESKALAHKLGLDDVLASNQGTGFCVLVNAESKKEITVLTNKQSSEEMLALVAKQL